MENKKDNPKSFVESVMSEINKPETKMKPKFFFSFKAVASVLAIALVALLIVIINLVLHHTVWIHKPFAYLFLKGFGFMAFVSRFPFIQMMSALLLFVLLIWLVRDFKFYYQSNKAKLLFIFLISFVTVVLTLNVLGVNEYFEKNSVLKKLYVNPDDNSGIFLGKVLIMGEDTWEVTARGMYLLNLQHLSKPLSEKLKANDCVQVVGEPLDNQITVSAITQVPCNISR